MPIKHANDKAQKVSNSNGVNSNNLAAKQYNRSIYVSNSNGVNSNSTAQIQERHT